VQKEVIGSVAAPDGLAVDPPAMSVVTRSTVGVLLLQLGTPRQPTYGSVFVYLRQFLSDRRVIEVPRWLWLPLLYLRILPWRSAASAGKYRRIWHPQRGSPLLDYTQRQALGLQQRLAGSATVHFAMTYGRPAIDEIVAQLIRSGIERLIAVPLYPQYSATTTAAATDALFRALLQPRRVPSLRIVPPFYAHPAYLDAVATVIREDWQRLAWEPEHIVFSYHGIPQKYAQRGDPYARQVVRTTWELVRRLQLPRSRWTLAYQSRFGRSPWLKPYTDDVLQSLARRGVRRVYVALPGFTADCLETIDEIGRESRELFERAGGEHLCNGTCLNDHPCWIAALEQIIRQEGCGWL
jgi:ferrochelatase